MNETLAQALMPMGMDILDYMLMVAIGIVTKLLADKLGLQISNDRKEMLHSALMSGARAALSRGLTGTQAAVFAEDYARRSVTKTMKKLKPDAETLHDLARSKVEQLNQDALSRALAASMRPD